MGYTHYWYREKEIHAEVFAAIAHDFRTLCSALERNGVRLAGGSGDGEPVINLDEVCFNGLGDDSHETFYFPRILDLDSWSRPEKADRYFEFCKTARKSYDLAVTAFLIMAKHYLGDSIIVRSDGDIDEWQKAIKLCFQVLGYGLAFQLDESD